MLRTQDNITNVIIAKDINRSGGATAGTLATPALLADGEVVITDASLQILNTTTVLTHDRVFIVQGRGATKNLKKYVIVRKEVEKYLGTSYAAAVEQVSYVGYDGTSGAIDLINDNKYIIRFNRRPNHFVRGNTNWYKYITALSTATATEQDIASKLAKSFYSNFFEDRKIEDFVKMEVLCNDAGTSAVGATADTVVGVKGSKLVTVTDTAANGTVNAIVAGDWIRIGTATTAPVYKVAASTVGVNGGVLTLEVPLEENVSVAGDAAEIISAASAATASFGVKFTGRPYKFEVVRWGDYQKVRFILGLENFGVTTQSTPTVAFEGTGVYEEVALNDWMSWANDGQTFIEQTPPLVREADAVVGETYSPLSLIQFSPEKRMLSNGNLKSEILIYTPFNAGSPNTLAGQATGTTGYVAVLDAYIAPMGFTAQAGNLI